MTLIAVAVTAGVIEVQQAQRKVPVQSAQRVLNVRTGMASQGRRNFLPLRVNAAGVIPIIFAISIMTFPTIFANLFQSSTGWTLAVSLVDHDQLAGDRRVHPAELPVQRHLLPARDGLHVLLHSDRLRPRRRRRQPEETVDVHPGHQTGPKYGGVSRQGHGPDHARRRALPRHDHRRPAVADGGAHRQCRRRASTSAARRSSSSSASRSTP